MHIRILIFRALPFSNLCGEVTLGLCRSVKRMKMKDRGQMLVLSIISLLKINALPTAHTPSEVVGVNLDDTSHNAIEKIHAPNDSAIVEISG